LVDVPLPQVVTGHVLVDVRASLISAGTERMVTAFAEKSLLGKARARPDLVRQVREKAQRDGIRATWQSINARLDDPLPLGYAAAGEVLAVGAGLEGRFCVGDRVAIGGAGAANHADVDLVPGNLAVKMPDEVPYDAGCFATLGAIALHSVRLVRPQLGEWVGIVGAGLVGLLAAQFARLSGAKVAVFDYDRERLALARSLGAGFVWDLGDGDPAAALLGASGGLGCDSVVLAASTDSAGPFETAATIARDRATVCMVGISGTAFPYRAFMHKELNIVVARSYGPGRYDPVYERQGMAYPEGYVRWTETENLRAVVDLLADRRLDVASLTTHRIPFVEAEAAYRLMAERREPHLGIVLEYEKRRLPQTGGLRPLPVRRRGPQACVVGVIGAGQFARTVILPRLAKLPEVQLKTVVSARGLSAELARSRFGFAAAAGDADAVLNDPAIAAVFVLSPHGTHAELAVRALALGKSVYVEKPLALNRAELEAVKQEAQDAPGILQVGFNRRFAPLTIELLSRLKMLPGRRQIVIRVNAGLVGKDSWESEAGQGGGRVLGEACHFVDLAQCLAGAPLTAVQAAAAGTGSNGVAEDFGAQMMFADGSLATLAYTTTGDRSYSKESVEVFCAGEVFRLDDFRELVTVRGGRTRRQRAAQDKGHMPALQAFAEAVRDGGPGPMALDGLFRSSLATIALKESMLTGAQVRLDRAVAPVEAILAEPGGDG
jgi:predicted dehydrogenase/threonine dehydrogenase-like Zn-dependent dehydrogenase